MESIRRIIDTEVSEVDGNCYRAIASLVDPFHKIEVVLLINAVDLVIVESTAVMTRIPYAEKCPDSLQHLSELHGLHIGPGLGRTVREAVGGDCGCPYVVELVVQACKLTIVASSAEQARNAILIEDDQEKFSKIHKQMGQCAGHRDLPTGRLPDWLEQERKKNG